MPGPPIEITLYEPGKDPGEGVPYRQHIVSVDMLKRAVRLNAEMQVVAKKKDAAEPEPQDWISRFRGWLHRNDYVPSGDEEALDRTSELVADFFGNQFTAADLRRGADFGEIMTVITAIISRAQGGPKFPTKPQPKRARRR